MKRYLRRLIYKTNDQKFTPFLNVFIIKTLVLGLMFTFFNGVPSVGTSDLYRLTSDYLPIFTVNMWGVVLLITVALHVCEMIFRGKGFGTWVGVLGVMAWVYAAFTYIVNGAYFATIAITGTSIYFYIWYLKHSTQYRYQLMRGEIDPVD